MRTFTTLAALAAISTLSACSGGGGGGGIAADRAQNILNVAENPAYQFQTSVFAMPTSGSATYTGHGAVFAERAPGDDLLALGTARVNVDFSRGSVNGRVDNFVDENDRSIGGSITMSDRSRLSGSFVSMTGGGTLTDNGRATSVSVNGRGDFVGASADAFFVYMDGSAITNGYVGDAEVLVTTED